MPGVHPRNVQNRRLGEKHPRAGANLTPLHHRTTFFSVRTTVNLDEDVWRAAKAKADYENKTLGAALSELARQGLAPSPTRKIGCLSSRFQVA